MSTVVVPASNQWLIRVGVGTVTATTDPIALDGADSATAILNVHELFGGSSPAERSLRYHTQTSIDGVAWVDQGPSDSASDPGVPPPATGAVNGTLIRFVFLLELLPPATGVAGTCFDLHVRLRKS